MSALAHLPFAKMNGLGNEIIVLDLRGKNIHVSALEARAIAAGKGLAYDQLMVLEDPHRHGTQAYVKIYNNDGTQSGACGNGTRCVAWHLMRDQGSQTLVVETKAGLLTCERKGEWNFSVDMGTPKLDWADIPLRDPSPDTRQIHLSIGPADQPILSGPSAVNMGNPHAIFFVEAIEAYDLAHLGPILEHDPIFPEKANISLAQILSPDHIKLKVWERGVGLTQACGTAACAAAVAGARKGLTHRQSRVSLPGGDLYIDWRESDDHVIMTGPVELEFEGHFSPDLFAGLPA